MTELRAFPYALADAIGRAPAGTTVHVRILRDGSTNELFGHWCHALRPSGGRSQSIEEHYRAAPLAAWAAELQEALGVDIWMLDLAIPAGKLGTGPEAVAVEEFAAPPVPDDTKATILGVRSFDRKQFDVTRCHHVSSGRDVQFSDAPEHRKAMEAWVAGNKELLKWVRDLTFGTRVPQPSCEIAAAPGMRR